MSFAIVAAVALAAPAAADPVVSGFNKQGGLPACADCFSGAIAPGFDTNVFGTTRNVRFVSNNGYATFEAGLGSFTPTGLGAGYVGRPIIAPVFADADTRGGPGSVTFGTGTFAGWPAWGASWLDTGYVSVRG
ncbi:nidogen-like domain-containing protein [Thermaurantiacus tibetensis]|uniref:nidogen-like domain-containing protein n=1 Tax=Thermaurantiacus tibetensis TaxID=2759035 RepID=UPI001A9C5944|nr:nidogen-like domain-containing protein [Thermaurantiacus tibetensis]